MFKAVFGSVLGKFAAVALVVTGVLGGLVLTGQVSGLGSPKHYMVAAAAGSQVAPGVTLDFPTWVVQPRDLEVPAEEVVEEVIVVQAAQETAPPAPVAPAVPSPQCVSDVTNALNAVVGAIPAIATAEQGQALLAHANAVGGAAANCLVEAQRVGFAGVDGVSHLVNQTGAVVAQISAIPVVAANSAQPGGQPNLVGGVVGGVGTVVGGTLNLVGSGLGLLGTGLDILTSPLK